MALESYGCHVQWFGSLVPTQVIANEGALSLLGTAIFAGRVWLADYVRKRLSVEWLGRRTTGVTGRPPMTLPFETDRIGRSGARAGYALRSRGGSGGRSCAP